MNLVNRNLSCSADRLTRTCPTRCLGALLLHLAHSRPSACPYHAPLPHRARSAALRYTANRGIGGHLEGAVRAAEFAVLQGLWDLINRATLGTIGLTIFQCT